VCLAALVLGFLPSRSGRAEERHREFVRKLQEHGYPDVALDYLRDLKKRDDLPNDVRAVLDYEIARTLVMQAEESDIETERKLLDEAAKAIGKFLQEYPDSEAATDASADLAGVLLKQGQQSLARAESEKDAARKKELRSDARGKFQQAHQRLTEAVAVFRAELRGDDSTAKAEPAEKPEDKSDKPKTKPGAKTQKRSRPRPKSQKEGEKDTQVEGSYIVARLNLAMTEYYLGRTFDAAVEAEKKNKKTQLDKAGQSFDDLFQQYRGSLAGFVAHLWHGRTLEEQGDLRQALMLYDEVIVNEPPIGQRLTREQAALFTQAQLFRLSVLNRQGKHEPVIEEAEPWLRSHQDRRRTPHGLGIQLELAKANLALAQKMPAGGERRQAVARALKVLNDEVGKFPGPHQNEAFRLRGQFAAEINPAGGKITSFDEGSFIGDGALLKEQWAQAADAYEQALDAYEKAPKPVQEKIDPDELDAVRYRVAYSQFKKGDPATGAAAGEKLAREKPQSKSAIDAAAIALVSHSSLYSSAKTIEEKESHLARLADLAAYIEQRWPQHSQADVARRTVGGILLYRRDFGAAAETYSRISAGSPLYADAQAKAGQGYWSAYLAELTKPESERDTAAMARWLDEARSALGRALPLLKTTSMPNTPVPANFVEAQLLLAEITLKTGSPADATPLLEPLLPLVTADRQDLAPLATRVLVGAMEAAIAQGDVAKAESLMADLEKQGGNDTTRITQVLVGLGRSLEQQLRQHDAAGRSDEAQSVRKSYETFLEKLAGREQQTSSSLQYLGEAYFALGSYERASDTFTRMIEKLEQEAKTAGEDAKSAEGKKRTAELQRVRLRRATSLRMTRQFQPALADTESLLKQNNNLLAAHMEKGRVLQDWGDENAGRLAEAAKWWDQIARKLQNMSPRPLEYFEARFGLAQCLWKLGKKEDAVRVLQSTMTLSPDCGGPEMKARYDALVKQLQPGGSAPSKTAIQSAAAKQ
jgi:tetratricopeptide (TPR) repeat protein